MGLSKNYDCLLANVTMYLLHISDLLPNFISVGPSLDKIWLIYRLIFRSHKVYSYVISIFSIYKMISEFGNIFFNYLRYQTGNKQVNNSKLFDEMAFEKRFKGENFSIKMFANNDEKTGHGIVS